MSGDDKRVENVEAQDREQLHRQRKAARSEKAKVLLKKLINAFKNALYPVDCTCDVC